MNGFARFVSRRLAAFAGFVLALAAVNLLIFGLFMSFFVLPAYGENSPARLLNQVAEASTVSGLPPELVLELRQRSVWAMLLDDAGGLQWGEGLPPELPQRYTVGQVAQFSRGYLADHPVFVQNTQNGLLVLGYPKNSYTKLTGNYYPLATVQALPWLAALLLALDLLALFLAYFCSRHWVLRCTAPLVDSIQALAQGEPVALLEKGELAPVAQGLNQAARVLARQNEARAGWIRGVSHDIRTPLSMILGYADRIAQSEQTPPLIRQQASIIRGQSLKIKQLVQDLNLVSQLEYEMQPLQKATLRPARLLRACVARQANEGLPQGCSLVLDLPPEAEALTFCGDERLLERALANLMGNSLRHNPAGCRVTVALCPEPGGFAIAVADNGSGVPPELLERLKAAGPGLPCAGEELPHGLGLLLVRQITAAHKGAFFLENLPQGGCCATLRFFV